MSGDRLLVANVVQPLLLLAALLLVAGFLFSAPALLSAAVPRFFWAVSACLRSWYCWPCGAPRLPE
jgi:hypothetical protein